MWLPTIVGLLVCMVCASYVWLSQCSDLRLFLPELIGCSAVIVISITALGCYADLHDLHHRPWLKSPWLVVVIFAIALVFRLLFAARLPQLSDDLYRYLWDGLQMLQGNSPYALAPEQIVPLTSQQQAIHPLINHPYLVTIYPPAAQVLFAASGGTIFGLKIICVSFDLGTCGLLWLLLKRLNRNPLWLTVYAWHPLVVLEGSASAHIDIVALFFVVLSLWLLTLPSERLHNIIATAISMGSAVSLAIAVMIKLFPAVFLPFFYLLLPRRQRLVFLITFLLSCLASVLLFWPTIINGFDTLSLYVNTWEFSSFSFHLLRTMFHSDAHARLILATLFGCIVVTQWWAMQQPRGTTDQTVDTLAKVVKGCARFLTVFLVLTPTLHPWYALYLVAFLALAPSAVGLTLSWSVLLSYQVLAVQLISGVWQESSLISLYVWLAPVLALLLTAVAFLVGKRRSRRNLN